MISEMEELSVRVTIERDDLVGILTQAMTAHSKRMAVPILDTVRLDAAASALRASCSTNEDWAMAETEAQVGEAGSICVGPRFADYVKTLPSAPVELTVEDDKLVVKQGRNRARFVTMDAQDFPTWPSVSGPSFTFDDAEVFAAAADRAIVCAATKYYTSTALFACHFEFSDEGVVLVSADGFRLAKVEAKYDYAEWSRDGYVAEANVPAASLKRFLTMAKKADNVPVLMTIGEERSLLRVGGLQFVTQHIAGVYPDYREILSRVMSGVAELTFSAEAMERAVRRAAVLAQDANDTVRFAQDGDFLRIGAVSDIGTNEGYVPISVVYNSSEEPVRFGLNAKYTLEMLKAMPSDEVRLRWARKDDPVLFDSIPGGYQHVIMPMYIADED